MAWRLANSLIQLRSQFNAEFPERNKSHDGTIGDSAHKSRRSDHNAWIQDAGVGVVSALDVTHDPGAGVDTWELADHLRAQRDARIKYIISNKRICSGPSWAWRKYGGSNPHSAHMHVSVAATKRLFDSAAEWDLVPENWKPTLRRGHKGRFVRDLQAALGLHADGVFGPQLETRVRQFQRDTGIDADGIVGKATWRALANVVPPEITAPPEATADEPPPEEDPDSPGARPVLRRGAHGDDVRTVQDLLLVRADGTFGETTYIAVRAFQRALGLDTDGIVGPTTWEALDELEQLPTETQWFENIVCTVFGGKKDPNESAYEKRMITDEELGCALPFRFPNDRPQVQVVNRANGKSVVCEVVDVGPWNTRDAYWEKGDRPQAETGKDTSGRRTNKAGIDLTPGAARAIGLSGKGMVDWAFADTAIESA